MTGPRIAFEVRPSPIAALHDVPRFAHIGQALARLGPPGPGAILKSQDRTALWHLATDAVRRSRGVQLFRSARVGPWRADTKCVVVWDAQNICFDPKAETWLRDLLAQALAGRVSVLAVWDENVGGFVSNNELHSRLDALLSLNLKPPLEDEVRVMTNALLVEAGIARDDVGTLVINTVGRSFGAAFSAARKLARIAQRTRERVRYSDARRVLSSA